MKHGKAVHQSYVCSGRSVLQESMKHCNGVHRSNQLMVEQIGGTALLRCCVMYLGIH
jgi:hypothetical protein